VPLCLGWFYGILWLLYDALKDDAVIETKTKAELQNEALRVFSAAMKEIKDEPLDDEFDEIVGKRVNIRNNYCR
jgi:hypothetical protein